MPLCLAGDRRAALERQVQASLAVLKRKCAQELAALSRLSDTLSVGDFVHLYGCSIPAAKAGASGSQPGPTSSTLKQLVDRNEDGQERDDILQTAKKRFDLNAHMVEDEAPDWFFFRRKRQMTGNSGLSTSHNNDENGSPSKPSKNMRMTNNSSVSRNTFTAPGSVYRARPSHVPYGQLNPRLPQTPHIGSMSGRGNTSRMIATQRRRLPKRNESIQAYSMNGSPLGILEIDVEQKRAASEQQQQQRSHASSSNAGPTSDADPPSRDTDGDWEVLHRHPLAPSTGTGRVSTVQQQYKAHQQRTLSPQKSHSTLGSVSGSMKAAFASKFGHHHYHANAERAGLSPAKRQFTMNVPSGAGQGKKEWDAWAEAFKRDLGNMSGLSAQDKKIVEDRLKQMGLD